MGGTSSIGKCPPRPAAFQSPGRGNRRWTWRRGKTPPAPWPAGGWAAWRSPGLIVTLRAAGADFARRWAEHEVAVHRSDRKTFGHPRVGRFTTDRETPAPRARRRSRLMTPSPVRASTPPSLASGLPRGTRPSCVRRSPVRATSDVRASRIAALSAPCSVHSRMRPTARRVDPGA
ncbi:hypothetical protein [Spirilliplanes yamanashiensis]